MLAFAGMSAPSTRRHDDGFTLGRPAGPDIARTSYSLTPRQMLAGRIQDPGDHDRGTRSRLAPVLGHQAVADVEPLVAALTQALEGDHIREGGEQPVARRAVVDERSRQPSGTGSGDPQHMGPASRKQRDVAGAQ